LVVIDGLVEFGELVEVKRQVGMGIEVFAQQGLVVVRRNDRSVFDRVRELIAIWMVWANQV